MITELTTDMILRHIEVSLISSLIATVLSVVIGYGFAVLFRRWFQSHPRIYHFLALLPWRLVATWIALVAVFSPLMVGQFGYGQLSTNMSMGIPEAGILMVSIALSVFLIPTMASMFLNSGLPANQAAKIISVIRTAAVISIALPVLFYTGIGYFLWVSSANLEMQKVIQGYEVLGAILVGVDLGLGFVQFLVSTRQNRLSGSQKNMSPLKNIG